MSRKNIEAIYKLTPVQQGMLMHTLMAPDSAAYFDQFVFPMDASIPPQHLVDLFVEMAARHGILRTSFLWGGKLAEPVQVVHKEVEVPSRVEDWSQLTKEEQAKRLPALCLADRQRGFDMKRAPLMRLTIIHMGYELRVVWSYHHILLDGWSAGNAVKELLGRLMGKPKGAVPRPFKDYVGWLQTKNPAASDAYWQRVLGDFDAPTPLAVDRPLEERSDGPDGGFERHTELLPADLDQALSKLARELRTTPFSFVQAAWGLTLSRYSGHRDVVFGITLSGRPAALKGAKDMLGCFINTLPVRVRIEGQQSVEAFVKEQQKGYFELLEHEHSPLIRVHRHSGVPTDQPLFESILVAETFIPRRDYESFQRTNYPLALMLRTGREGTDLGFGFDLDRFEPAAVERLHRHLLFALRSLVEAKDRPLIELPQLEPHEHQQLLYDWNATAEIYDAGEQTLPALFAAQVRRAPDAVALIFENQQLTYRQLDERVAALAAHLRQLGVGPEARVAVAMQRSIDLVVALYSIHRAGGAYVPIDPEYPQDRVAFMLQDAAAAVLLTESSVVAALPPETESGPPRILLDRLSLPSAGALEARPASPATADHLAYVIYTSGSTGRPKGAMNNHRGILNRLLWMQQEYQLSAEDRVLQKTPFSFDVSVWEFFWPLITGATLVVAKPGGHRDPGYLVSLIAEHQVTTLHFVPPMLQVFLQHPDLEPCRGLRRVMASGEALPAAMVDRFYERLGDDAGGEDGGPRLHNLYGPTEAAVDVTYWPTEAGQANTPIGRPVANTRLYIVDADLRPVPMGAAGELLLGGVQVARGYHGRAGLTAERFVPNPFAADGAEAGGRLYRTGDLVRYRTDGVIDYLGRLDFQVKIRGFRIELGEIEAALEDLSAVRQAVVLARPSASGDLRLVAYVVAPETDYSVAGLRSALADRLPDYMVPASWVRLDELPLTGNGKLDRKALPAPDQDDLERRVYVAPRSETESVLATIWSELLEVERVGVEDHFFELGGHSLVVTQVASRIRQSFEVELSLPRIFDRPILADLALEVDLARQSNGQQASAPPLVPLTSDGEGGVDVERRQQMLAAGVPLSFSQDRLWFLDQLMPGSTAYNLPGLLRLRGPLRVDLFRQALHLIVQRHETLRTRFESIDGQARQIVESEVELPMPLTDLSQGPSARQAEGQLRRRAAELTAQPFDLARAPLLRIELVKLAPEDHATIVVMHHIISDGWSLGVLLQELQALYDALLSGRTAALPELPVQYPDFAAWQRQWLESGELQRQMDVWKQRLADAPTVLELPTDRPAGSLSQGDGGIQVAQWPKQLQQHLQAYGRKRGVTPFMVVLAAFQALLGRLSGQSTVLVGSPIANRNRIETEGLIGFFVNTLVLRGDLDGDPSFAELFLRSREVTLEAYGHQDVPFEKLVDELAPQRSLDHSPLFQAMFSMQRAPAKTPTREGLVMEPMGEEVGSAKFHLNVALHETDDGIVCLWAYPRQLFDGTSVRRFSKSLQTLVRAALENDAQKVDDVSLLSAVERQQLLVEWNSPRPDYKTIGLVHELVVETGEARPEAVAAVFEGDTLSYGELLAQSALAAAELQRRGVGPDVIVGVCLGRCFQQIVSLLAVLRAGGAYLPLDPSIPEERLAYMIDDGGASLVLTAEPWAEQLPQGVQQVRVDTLLGDTSPGDASPGDTSPVDGGQLSGPRPTPANLAYVIYTSGSTGKPKGVMISHRAMRNRLIFDTTSDASADSRYLGFSSIGFDMSMAQIFPPLLSGGRIVLLRSEDLSDPAYLLQIVEREGITNAGLPPVVLESFLGSLPEGAGSSLQQVVSGGEALARSLVQTFYERLPGVRLANRYGPTEATVAVTSGVLQPDLEGRVPIGRPIAKSAIYLVDRHLRPVPLGAIGELLIGGQSLGRGYLARPDLTAERFVPNPFPVHDDGGSGGRRLYRTGDLARWRSDGNLEFMGRVDQQVKIRGFRVELGEIETLLREHPQIDEVAVVDLPDGSTRRLAAYVVAEAGMPEAAELRRYLSQELPDYMVPSAFVGLDALPRTSAGKLDRRALPSPEWRSGGGDPPQGEDEQRLAAVFCQVLGLESIGRDDDFFDLGGHSLLATQVMARLRQEAGIDLPLRLLFEAPTVAGLAVHMEGARGLMDGAPPLVPQPRDDGAPLVLSHAQERLWFIDQLLGANAVYNLILGVRLKGELDVEALQSALDAIALRHQALRSRFLTVDGQAHVVVDDPAPVALRHIDLTHLEVVQAEAEVQRQARNEGLEAFDLAVGPLLRVTLLRPPAVGGEAQHVLLLVMHHIISDGWSMQVMLGELAQHYRAAVGATEGVVQLPPLPIQYSDFAAWQRQWLQGEVMEAQMDYWRQTLKGASAVLEVPTDRARPTISSFAGANVNDRLPRPHMEALEALAKKQGGTLFMALLAVFQLLMSRLSGQLDINVGTPIANRQRTELEGLIGFFVNTLVLRGDLSGNLSFGDLLERTREATLGAYAHQDVPFEKLVGELAPDRDLAQNSLFQVMLTLQNAAVEPIELPGLVLEQIPPDGGTSQFDLTLTALARPWGLDLSLAYKTELFDDSTAERWMGHLETLLRAVAEAPDRPLAELSLLSAAERHQLLVDWDGRPTVYNAEVPTVHRLVSRVAEEDPSRWALVDGEGGHLTYGELEARANQLAHRLRHMGAGPEQLVGLCLERSMDLVVALLAVLKSGAAYLPLDLAYPQERLAFMLEDSAACLLISNRQLEPKLPSWDGSTLYLDDEAEQLRIAASPTTDPAVAVHGDHLAYVIYTSGSTGRPKGVQIPHRNVARLLAATQEWFDFGAEDRWTFFHSHAFDFSVWEIWGALATGGRLVVVPYWVSRSPEAFYGLLRDEGVTVLNQTPSAFRQLVEVACQAPSGESLALRQVIFGGEALDLSALAPWFERYGDQRPRLVNMYGITETTVHVTYRPLTADDLGLGIGSSVGSSPVGRAIPDLSLQVLDARGMPQPIGVPGEIHVGGAGLARGYLGRPALTAERFVPDPFATEPGARLYRSGDLARYLVDGDLDFLGRIDHQVKIRGFRIELGEIEAALEDLPAMQRAVVLALPGAAGDLRLVAYLQSSEPEATTVEGLRLALEDRLPVYMVPAAFVMVEDWPLTANGKLDRRALPDPDAERLQLAGGYAAPRNDIERALAEVWQGVLGLERVGIHDNFFELGGDSILSIQVISRAKTHGLELQPQHVFQHPTIAALALMAGETVAIEAEQGAVTGMSPMTPIQRHFFSLDLAQPAHYNQAFMLAVPSLDAASLERAVAALMDHHDQLRAVFQPLPEGGWRQEIKGPGLQAPCTTVDLSALAEEARRAAIETAAQEAQRSFDLSSGPLLRVVYFSGLGDDGSHPDRLLIVAHHLVIDGVSWRILLEDVERAYKAEAAGKAADLGLKTTSFKGWAERLESWAKGDDLATELPYWTTLAEGLPAPLPVDLEGPAERNDVASARSVSVHLGKEATEALLRQVPAAYRTQINDVLLTALAEVLAGWNGERRQGVVLEGHGRENLFADADTSRTVGWFTSLFPVLLELPPEGDVGASLKAVKEQLRALPRRGIGYGALRYGRSETDSGSETARQQLAEVRDPQVSFNYLGQVDLDMGQGDSFFAPAEESTGGDRGAANRRDNLLDVTVGVASGGARITWIYSDKVHQRQTIEKLAAAYVEVLEGIIAHCTADGAGGYTPSDFPLAKLEQATLDELFAGDREVEDVYPLSPLQEGLLVHTLAIPGRYFEQMRVTFRGSIEVDRFRRAWQNLLQRHTILRSAFLWRDLDRPLQVVRRQAEVEVNPVDWRQLPAAERQGELERFLAADRRRGFELDRAPLLRLHLLRLDGEQTWIIFSHHHLLLDGWSTPLLLREVFASYAALAGEMAATQAMEALPPVRPFGEYIAWLEEQETAAQETFWRRYLAGFENPTPLLSSRRDKALLAAEDTAVLQRRGISKRVLPSPTLKALQSLTHQHKVTLNTLLQGVWALVLGRAVGEDDVVFGATVSGRGVPLEGMEHMLGMFINTLPVRVRLRAEQPLGEWLTELQSQQGEASQFEHSSLMEVQGWSDVQRPKPLFESILIFENYPVGGSDQMGAMGVQEMGYYGGSDYPLALVAVPRDDLSLSIGYDVSRFDVTTVERALDHLVRALDGFVAEPTQPLHRLPLLSSAERQQLLVEWNQSQVTYEVASPLMHRPVFEQAERQPRRVAVAYGGEHLSYGELAQRARHVARRLRQLGVGPEKVVAVHMERSFELIVGYLAVLEAGGAYLPLDPATPGERLAHMVRDAGVAVLLNHGASVDWLATAQLSDGVHVEPVPTVRPGEISADAVDGPLDDLGLGGDHPAYVIYTSGSTGQPKGVVVPHRAVANRLAYDCAYDVHAETRYLQNTAVAFDMSVPTIFSPLWVGGRTVLVEAGAQQDPNALLQLMTREGVNRAGFPPQMLSLLLDEEALTDGPSFEFIGSGGDAMSADLPRRFYERLPETKLLNRYGPTEATVAVTTWLFPRHDEGVDGPPPIGRPMANARIDLVDSWLEPVPIGVAGELLIGGDCLARGYLGDAARTAERFMPNPFATTPGERLYRTGDLARHRPDGAIEFLGRIDHQVKIRGFRVELGEIENQLLEHAAIRRAAVIDVGDGDDRQLVAYLVAADGQTPSQEELTAHLATSLPEYMVPSAFIPLDELPVSSTGKVDRRQLPDASEFLPTIPYVAPQGPWEEAVATIFAEVLGREQVGSADDFFVLGGHSLMAARVVSRVRRELDVDLPLGELFAQPRVADLAQRLERLASGAATPRDGILLPLSEGSGRPLFCVHPVAGIALCYRDLALELGPAQGLVGLQSPALSGGELVSSVEELATQYIEAIRRHQPQGPYDLAGWSFGGLVAYEMARQLSQQGEQVAFLGLLDAVQTASRKATPERSDIDRLLQACQQFLGDQVLALEARLAGVAPGQQRAVLEAWLVGSAELEVSSADLDRYLEVQEVYETAHRQYRPRPYGGRVDFFRAAERRADEVENPADPWRPLSGELVEHVVAGRHESMVFTPNSASLAAALRPLLASRRGATTDASSTENPDPEAEPKMTVPATPSRR